MNHKLFLLRLANLVLAGLILALLLSSLINHSGKPDLLLSSTSATKNFNHSVTSNSSRNQFTNSSDNPSDSDNMPSGSDDNASDSGSILSDSNDNSFFKKSNNDRTSSSQTSSDFAQGNENATSGSQTSSGSARNNATATSEKKQIALTFDDGPDGTYTPMLLDGLKDRNVKATFFLLGAQIEQYPEIVTRMYEDGHLIGCHSYEHVNFTQISENAACEQIKTTCDLIYELTGERSAFVRPPYGSWPTCLDDDLCMIPVLWDVDPLDWATDDASLIASRILDAVQEYDIILLHDASESSVQAALQVIDTLSNENYEFVTVEELIMP